MPSTPPLSLLILCYGEGGHHAQAKRLMALFRESAERMPDRVLCITDRTGIGISGAEEIVLLPLREKHGLPGRLLISMLRGLVLNLRMIPSLVRASRSVDRVLLVSLGPTFTALPAFVTRLTGGTVVHIETWSRISTRSATGRVMNVIAHEFLIQSESLQSLYPRATFVGRL